MQFVRSEEPRQPLLLGVDEAAYFCLTSRLDISFLCLLDSTEWMFFGRPGWLERESFESIVVVHLVREVRRLRTRGPTSWTKSHRRSCDDMH